MIPTRSTSEALHSDGLHCLGRWTSDRARANPERVAVDDRGVVLTYGELEDRASALAEAFIRAGYLIGDRISSVTGNSADHVVFFFACAKAGLVLVPLSWRLSVRELSEQMQLADPALLVFDDEFATLARAAADRAIDPPQMTQLGASGVEHRVLAPKRSLSDPEAQSRSVRGVRDDDALLMIFTSGTQGRAKGALLTHANCFWTNLSFSRIVELTSDDVVLAMMPQYHVGGWNIQVLLAWWVGATVVLERTFDPGRVLQLIADRRITTMMGVPTNYLFLAQHPAFTDVDLTSLTHAIVGGAPMPEPLLRTWHARGVALSQGYGLTEASPNVLCLPDEDATRMAGFAGLPYPHVEVAVADPITGERLEGPAYGELLLRGPGVFAGYFRDPELTAQTLRKGWLHTGDLVMRNTEGFFQVLDRLTDVFISGGESVAPAEVERVLFEHPAVNDSAVVGVPDERWGEVGVAFVLANATRATDEAELLAHVRAELAKFKVPSRVLFVNEIPRSEAGKVLRHELLEQWRGTLAEQPPVLEREADR